MGKSKPKARKRASHKPSTNEVAQVSPEKIAECEAERNKPLSMRHGPPQTLYPESAMDWVNLNVRLDMAETKFRLALSARSGISKRAREIHKTKQMTATKGLEFLQQLRHGLDHGGFAHIVHAAIGVGMKLDLLAACPYLPLADTQTAMATAKKSNASSRVDDTAKIYRRFKAADPAGGTARWVALTVAERQTKNGDGDLVPAVSERSVYRQLKKSGDIFDGVSDGA